MDVPFPLELLESKQNNKLQIITDSTNSCCWIKPFNLNELLEIKNEFPSGKLVSGNSEIGVEMKFKGSEFNCFIYVADLKELQQVSLNKEEQILEIGVNITLTSLIDELNKLMQTKTIELYQYSLLKAFLANLRWFASNQIRNFATLAGNITTASPISDLNPILIASNASLTIQSKQNGVRTVLMRDFFLGYRKIDLKSSEIVVKVNIHLPKSNLEIYRAYKQAKRKDDDIAITNAGFRVVLNKEFRINELDLSFGGVAPITIYLKKINEKTKNMIWGDETNLKQIQDMILEEVNLSYSVPGGMPTFRRTLAVSFFTKFWYQICKELEINSVTCGNLEDIERDISSSKLDFGTNKKDSHIGVTTPHLSALKQTTGVAKYLDDIPKIAGEQYAGLVLSTKAHALILKIDASEALSLPGVNGFITYKDVPKNNHWGIMLKDEEFFASNEVLFVGQLIGVIVANTKQLAKKAANLVHIEYKELDVCLNIQDALEKNSFYDGFNKTIEKGTFSQENTEDLLVFEGECHVGGQEHFYLETHGCLIVPRGEDSELDVYSSTQHPTETQTEIAHALGVPLNRICCRVKRLGGGFGGKETRATFLAVVIAVAVNKLGVPIRCVLDRDIDMLTTGTRHPFYGKYKIYCTKDGIFKSYSLDLIANAGHSYDLSRAVMERAMTHCDNVYMFPHLKVNGRLAKTNIASNTAFRGFGGPQGMMITELMIAEIADRLQIDALKIREQNMYKPYDLTHYNMPLEDYFIPEMWPQILADSEYEKQKENIEKFNSENKWKKRGIAILPTKFGISFTARFLNQAGALVHIYSDGSVLLSHAGVEMGQGLHTKMIQIAANTLDIDESCIHIVDTRFVILLF
jgi:xanthine dehydrogenase/oxidase